ncbi:response regulator [Nitrospira sp. Nam80]
MASILIIQSKDVVRALYRELLERAGHEVIEESRGREGIQRYNESPTTLVITDLHLPDCDGLEVIVALGQDNPSVKIIAVSTQTGSDDALMTSKLFGANAIVHDALDCETLLKKVQELLDGT